MTPDEYAVRLIDLPASVGGFIHESPDGYTNIYINARHGHRGQLRALGHELRHAEADDLRSSEPLSVIEARADGADQRLKSIPTLIRARNLPSPPPKNRTEEPPLTPRQLRILAHCVSELDHWLYNDALFDY